MRILPPELSKEIEGLIEKGKITLDLYEILGQCTWGKNELATAQICPGDICKYFLFINTRQSTSICKLKSPEDG